MSEDPVDTSCRPWLRRALRAGFGAFIGACVGWAFAARFATHVPSTVLVFAGLGALLGLWGWEALRSLLDAFH